MRYGSRVRRQGSGRACTSYHATSALRIADVRARARARAATIAVARNSAMKARLAVSWRAVSALSLLPCLAAAICLAGCGGHDRAERARSGRPARSASAASAAADPRADPAPRSTPAGPIAIDARVERGGGVSIRVVNRSEHTLQLDSVATLERRTGAHWTRATDIRLLLSCETPRARCVTLAPGAELIPPACACPRCSALEPGQYVARVERCGGGGAAHSEAIDLRTP